LLGLGLDILIDGFSVRVRVFDCYISIFIYLFTHTKVLGLGLGLGLGIFIDGFSIRVRVFD